MIGKKKEREREGERKKERKGKNSGKAMQAAHLRFNCLHLAQRGFTL